MLKLTVKLIFSLVAIIALVHLFRNSEEKDPKFWMSMLTAIGVLLITTIDLWDYRKLKKETDAADSANRKKRLRDILDNFKANFCNGLIDLKIIESKSELTYERIYELSRDAHVIVLLNEHEFVGIRNELEEFKELYMSDK